MLDIVFGGDNERFACAILARIALYGGAINYNGTVVIIVFTAVNDAAVLSVYVCHLVCSLIDCQ